MFGTPGRRPAPLPDSALDADYAYPFSSGTTGLPKAVRHTHRSLVAAVINWNSACAVRDEDHVQFFLPLFHIYGIAITGCTWVSAATITLVPALRPRRDAVAHRATSRVTLAFGAAPIAVAMANHPELEKYDLSSLRYMMWAATPDRRGRRQPGHRAHGHPLAAARTAPPRCRACTAIRSTTRTGGASTRRACPVSDLEVRIVDLETHEDVAPGTEGEIIVRGPHMMAGYLPAEADADAFLDGWSRTGDVGWVEPEGWIHITDRAKEMIKVSGFSVAPAEIEATLHGASRRRRLRRVRRAARRRRARRPRRRSCSPRPTPPPPTTCARTWPSSSRGTSTWRTCVFVDAIPRTASGKVLRRTLKDTDASLGAAR